MKYLAVLEFTLGSVTIECINEPEEGFDIEDYVKDKYGKSTCYMYADHIVLNTNRFSKNIIKKIHNE